MRHDNNNLPIFAERLIQTTTIEDLQTILTQFKQVIPSNFIQLETLNNKNYMCSTTGWKEPTCERYGFLVNGKWEQFDISQEILAKLDLKFGENISYSIYISPSVLEKELNLGAHDIENETEIFLDKPLNINNLENELKRLFAEIENLKGKKSDLENRNENQQNSIDNLQNEKDNLVIQVSRLEELLAQTQNNSQSEITSLKDWIKKIKFELVPLFWPNSVYSEDTPTAEILLREVKSKIDNLTSEINILSQRPTEEQLQEKQREVNKLNDLLSNSTQHNFQLQTELNNERVGINNLQQQLNQKNSEINTKDRKIADLINEKQQLETQSNNLNSHLTIANQTIANRNTEIQAKNNQITNLTNERDSRPNITNERYSELNQIFEDWEIIISLTSNLNSYSSISNRDIDNILNKVNSFVPNNERTREFKEKFKKILEDWKETKNSLDRAEREWDDFPRGRRR